MKAAKESFPRAEDALRLLATAASAARLYPPTSTLPAEAVARFAQLANDAGGEPGPLRVSIDPDGFHVGGVRLAQGNTPITSLAKSLYALQVGQLVIAPGLTPQEAQAFIGIVNTDPARVRAGGGMRKLLATAGVAHIAVIEVSLRATEEEGLLGLDVLSAPVDDVAAEAYAAAERWATTAGTGHDEVADVVGRLEQATREIAVERISAALMRLDEPSRLRVLGMALKADATGRRMEGMLDVIAHMQPAALARMLTLVAAQAGTDPPRIAAALTLPPDAAKLLASMLAPLPEQRSLEECADEDTAEVPTAFQIAQAMAGPDELANSRFTHENASPALSASRALSTTIAVSRVHEDSEAVAAIGETLPGALAQGAFPTVREALRRLDELAQQFELARAVSTARATCTDPQVLAAMCIAIGDDADAAIAGEILNAAGLAGAQAAVDAYIQGDDYKRSLLRPVLRGMSDSVLAVSRTTLQQDDPHQAFATVRMLSTLEDRRSVLVLSRAIGHLDEQVRFAAISALADMHDPEAVNALVKAIDHPEPETQRFAVREIGRTRIATAVHPLARALDAINVRQRTHEMKKEIVRALGLIGNPEAIRVLRRSADRGFVWGRKNRELREQARHALEVAVQSERIEGAE